MAAHVKFTATVSAVAPGSGTPTGTVTFYDGTTVLGTASMRRGIATFTISSMSVGTHSITAVYSGDTNFQTSTSAVLNQVVDAAGGRSLLKSPVDPTGFAMAALPDETDPGALIETLAIEQLSALGKPQVKATRYVPSSL